MAVDLIRSGPYPPDFLNNGASAGVHWRVVEPTNETVDSCGVERAPMRAR